VAEGGGGRTGGGRQKGEEGGRTGEWGGWKQKGEEEAERGRRWRREEEGGASVTKDHDIQDVYKLVIDRAVVACKFADEHAQVWWCVYVMKLRERTHSSGLEWGMHL